MIFMSMSAEKGDFRLKILVMVEEHPFILMLLGF